MFHQIEEEKKWYNREYALDIERFRHFIDNLINEGKHFEKLDKISQCVEGEPQNVYLSFDDGFEGVYTYVLPYLREKNIPFAIFITTNFIGKEGYLTENMLLELNQEPLCTIGAHTCTHPFLRQCSNKQALNEIAGSKATLEKILGEKIWYFAYPYGSFQACSLKDKRIVKKTGYRNAFSTIQTPVTKRDLKKKYFIPRINVGAGTIEE
jgi:peptidoglycan/xylan/chitin deacetylase (PgdA/CDA1 family)